jgi:hypothetical protein
MARKVVIFEIDRMNKCGNGAKIRLSTRFDQ